MARFLKRTLASVTIAGAVAGCSTVPTGSDSLPTPEQHQQLVEMANGLLKSEERALEAYDRASRVVGLVGLRVDLHGPDEKVCGMLYTSFKGATDMIGVLKRTNGLLSQLGVRPRQDAASMDSNFDSLQQLLTETSKTARAECDMKFGA